MIHPRVPASMAVVICSFTLDRWAELCAAVGSVRAQRLRPMRIIVVVDHCPDLLERARHAFDDCVVVPNHYARGLSGARTTGLDACDTDLIAFLDDDAEADADWTAVLADGLRCDRTVAAGGAAIPRWETGRPPWFPRAFDWVVGCSYQGLPTTSAPVRNVLGCNMAFRTHELRAAGGFDARLGRIGASASGVEETEACIRVRRTSPGSEVRYLPSARVHHFVPRARASWRYFVRRCIAEGRSKAILTTLVGSTDALSSERRYTTRVLPLAAASAVGAAIRKRHPALALQVPAIIGGLVLTAAGYAWGRVSGVRSVAAMAGS